MKIIELYDKYFVPPILRRHMLGVANVAMFLLDNWKGKSLNQNDLIKLCLTHDLGNLVRMNLDSPIGDEFSTEDLDFWKQKKQEIIDMYGNIDDEVTTKILTEVGFDPDLTKTINDKRFANSINISKSNNWLLKILLYSDLRVLPTRIGTLKERLDEVISRRRDLSERSDINELCKACFKIESEIQSNLKVSVDLISDQIRSLEDKALLETEI